MTIDSVRERRIARGLTQAELAERCAEIGVPTTGMSISRIERGVHTPRPRLRWALNQLLDPQTTREEVSA